MRFNQQAKSNVTETVNYEGGPAFNHLTPQHELYARVGTCLVKEPKFYGDIDAEFNRIKELIKIVSTKEPDFLLQLGAYARNILHLRSIPVVLLGLASLSKDARQYVKQYTSSIIQRPDELAEVIAFIESEIGPIGDEKQRTMLPHSLQKGLQIAFTKFNEYGFSKYDRNNSAVTMKDVIRLVHPKPTNDNKELYRKIAKDELTSADTWEVLISSEGSTKENWERAAKKMPIMAILRNLRNLLDNDCSNETFDYVIQKLVDPKVIQNSKQFPFRFFSAYKAIEGNDNPKSGRLLTALDTSMMLSINNLPILDGTTAVFSDNSGSMHSAVSSKSEVEMIEIGAVLSAIATIISPDSIVGVFGTDFARLNFSQNDSILGRTQKIKNKYVGMSTNAHIAMNYLVSNNIKVDRIFLFSDMQCYDSGDRIYNDGYSVFRQWEEYKRTVNPNAYLYSFDLDGYGTTQVPENDRRVLTIAGWSEAILKYIPYFEKNRDTVLQEIRAITPTQYLNMGNN